MNRYNKRSKKHIEMINCYCGYEDEFPEGTCCPGCGEYPDDYEEEDYEDKTDEMFESIVSRNPELAIPLRDVTEYIQNSIPSIYKILTTPMILKDRARLLELFEMMNVCQPLTPEWDEVKELLVSKFQTAVKNEKYRSTWSKRKREQVETQLSILNDMTTDCGLDYKITQLDLPDTEKVKVFQRFKTWETMEPSNEEYGKIFTWINTVLSVPWNVYGTVPAPTKIDRIIRNIQVNFDKHFYGLEKVKEQLLLFIHHRLHYPESKMYMLGLCGPPGTGKTSIVQVLSESLSVPFHQISGGSLMNSDSIYGHSYTYIGAEPGAIAKACISLKTLGGIVFVDEFEKIALDKCIGALLHVFDPVQNHKFTDRYLDIPVDLSKMLFVGSMNDLPSDKALSDRIFPIKLEGYSFDQKFHILKKITLPKILSELDIQLNFTDDAIKTIMRNSNEEPGVRHIIQKTQDIVRKLCFLTSSTCDISFRKCMKDWTPDEPITRDHIKSIINDNVEKHLSMYT